MKNNNESIRKDTTVLFIMTEKGGTSKHPEIVSYKTLLNSQAVQFFISDQGKPKDMDGNWKKMTKKQRLEANLAYTANGKAFSYKIIN